MYCTLKVMAITRGRGRTEADQTVQVQTLQQTRQSLSALEPRTRQSVRKRKANVSNGNHDIERYMKMYQNMVRNENMRNVAKSPKSTPLARQTRGKVLGVKVGKLKTKGTNLQAILKRNLKIVKGQLKNKLSSFTPFQNWNIRNGGVPFMRFVNIQAMPISVGTIVIKNYISEKLKSTIQQYKLRGNEEIVNKVINNMIGDYTRTNTRDMSGTHVTINIDNVDDIADFFCMQRVDMLHDFRSEKSEIQEELNLILKNDGEFLSVVFEHEIIPMNPHVPKEVLKRLLIDVTNAGGVFKKTVNDVLSASYTGWEKRVFEAYSNGHRNYVCNRRFIPEHLLRVNSRHQMIIDMSVTDQLRFMYTKFTPALHIASIVDAGQYFLPENHFWKRFKTLYDAEVKQTGRGSVNKSILKNIIFNRIVEIFPSRFLNDNASIMPVLDEIVSKIMSNNISTPENNWNKIVHLVDNFMYNIKEKINQLNTRNQLTNNRRIQKALLDAVKAVGENMAKKKRNSMIFEQTPLYAIDTQPFSYMIKKKYENYEICLNYVSIGLRINNANKSLDTLQVNKYIDLNIKSKPSVLKSLRIQDVAQPANNIYGRIYTKLMQKHLGDFIPVLYSQVFNRYYGTGDKMAANAYLLMYDIIRRNEATHILNRMSNQPTPPRSFKTKKRLFVESDGHVDFFGSEDCPVTVNFSRR